MAAKAAKTDIPAIIDKAATLAKTTIGAPAALKAVLAAILAAPEALATKPILYVVVDRGHFGDSRWSGSVLSIWESQKCLLRQLKTTILVCFSLFSAFLIRPVQSTAP